MALIAVQNFLTLIYIFSLAVIFLIVAYPIADYLKIPFNYIKVFHHL